MITINGKIYYSFVEIYIVVCGCEGKYINARSIKYLILHNEYFNINNNYRKLIFRSIMLYCIMDYSVELHTFNYSLHKRLHTSAQGPVYF